MAAVEEQPLTKNDEVILEALDRFLDSTHPTDWHLLHAVVREDVTSGRISRPAERAYRELVERKLMEAAQELRTFFE